MPEPIDFENFRKNRGLSAPGGFPLKSGDGDGTSGGMEARVAKLESDMEHVKKGVDKIEGGVSDIKKTLGDFRIEITKALGVSDGKLIAIDERTKHLPTRWETFLIVSGILAAMGVVITIATRFLPA